jgi:hypothetical protein
MTALVNGALVEPSIRGRLLAPRDHQALATTAVRRYLLREYQAAHPRPLIRWRPRRAR